MGFTLDRVWRDLAQTLVPLLLGIVVAVVGIRLGLWLSLPFLGVAGTLSGICLAGLGTLRIARRLLLPGVDLVVLYRAAALADPGRAWLGVCIVVGALVLALAGGAAKAATGQPSGGAAKAATADVPTNAIPLLPLLKAEQRAHWPGMPLPSTLAGQVEQETCISLTHPRCWSPRAELRTSREQGLGLPQITRAFRADGSTRFDSLAELRAQFPHALAGWAWDAPSLYDPTLQLRALVLMDHRNWQAITSTASDRERLAMALASYNGGLRGLAADRALCSATAGCDARAWFGHVERTCTKQQTAAPGYGQSFCAINRHYPVAIERRRLKYAAAMER